MTNPLLQVRFEIPFDAIRAEDVEPAIDTLIEQTGTRVDEIAAQTGELTYDSILGALEDATLTLEWASTVVAHLESVATTPALRAAYEAIQPRLSRFWTGIILHEPLWKLLRRYAETDDARHLTGVRKRHLEKTLDEFRRHGADLDTAGKAEIERINIALAELTTKFSQNVLDSTNAFELYIEDEDGLAGLPPSAREAAHESARAKGRDGWRFTLQAPSVVAVMTYLDDRATRETVWRAYNSRGTSPKYDNLPLVREILRLRREKATLLGYRDFADLVLADRMARNGDRARSFIDDLRDRTRDHFVRENKTLQAFARTVSDDPALELQPWDVSYYAEKLRHDQFEFDEEELRPYFPVDRVLEGLFRTIERLYGVQVTETDAIPVWDPSVRTFELRDDGRHLGSFYVDLYPRENKRDGAWMNALITGLDGRPHLGLFCSNANPPVGNRPALFTHREVETMFHEFGHLMHHCLSTVPVRSLAGTNVAWDWVELPSQIMENWCWEREALDLFAFHYDTGEPIPDELFEKMQRARTFRAANGQMRQLGFASLDLALHVDYDPADGPDLVTFSRDILAEYAPAPLPERYGFIGSFSHLFSSPVAYAAGYYSYKWSEVLDADAFTRFREEGVFNPDTGMAFRTAILARGDGEEPESLYRAFMGRDPRLEPLLERQGLT